MSVTNRSSYRATALAASALALLGYSAAAQERGITTAVSLVNEGPTVNEPIFVNFTVHNALSEPVQLDISSRLDGTGSFGGQVARPDGRSERGTKPRPGVYEVLFSKRTVSIAPGTSSITELLASAWADFDIPGRYIVEVEMGDSPKTETGGQLPALLPATVAFEVGPRDPERLERICAGLELRALVADGGEATSAILGLAYVKDDVAVPHLARLLQQRESLRPQSPTAWRGSERQRPWMR
jgi:hypothetical protein